MIRAIQNFCINTEQMVPKTVGEISRTIFESITFRYKQAVENLEDIIEKKLKILYIIGGGSQYNLLNQFTANILNIPIKAGPSEATVIGNILVQALALGEVKDLIELREIVRDSFEIKNFLPENHEKWKEAYFTYLDRTKK
jgi:rhamnulokinase